MNKKLVNANGKLVRYNGETFRVISNNTCGMILAVAENVKTGETHNLIRGRSALVMSIRSDIEHNLVH